MGSCASKHALLAEDLDVLGVPTLPLLLVGPLVPQVFADHPSVADDVDLVEVHECLTVITPWTGPLRVDITWDPPLIRAGLTGTLGWDGSSDMAVAVGNDQPGWSVPRAGIRAAKEALRARIYGPGERDRRDRTLAALAQLFVAYRDTDPARSHSS